MCDASLLREYGLLDAFDTVANMLGERVAIITGYSHSSESEDDVVDAEAASEREGEGANEAEGEGEGEGEGEDGDGEEEIAPEGVQYHELQLYSQSLATLLYYRFGVREGDKVLLACENHSAAEAAGMLACMRIGALFVPVDTLPLRVRAAPVPLSSTHPHTHTVPATEEASPAYAHAYRRLQRIVRDCAPAAAIVLAENDEDEVVLALSRCELFKCALVRSHGALSQSDASANSELLFSLQELRPSFLRRISTAEDEEEADALVDNSSNADIHNHSDDNKNSNNNTVFTAHPLYVLYTSGSSTGEPRGVVGTHEGLVSRLCFSLEQAPFDWTEVCLRRTPSVFVDALAELWLPLLAGRPIVSHLLREINAEGVFSVLKEMERFEVSRLLLIPSQLRSFCKLCERSYLSKEDKTPNTPNALTQGQGGEEEEEQREEQEKKKKEDEDLRALTQRVLSQLRYVSVSGEECSAGLVRLFERVFRSLCSPPSPCVLLNLYGSTEIAGDVSCAVLSECENGSEGACVWENKVSIGHAIPGNALLLVRYTSVLRGSQESSPQIQDIEVLDVCEGESECVGELLVIGEHVALGYMDSLHTAAHKDSEGERVVEEKPRFVANPFCTGHEALRAQILATQGVDLHAFSLAYLTGDLVARRAHSHALSHLRTENNECETAQRDESELFFCGRTDRLLKVRGQRISLDTCERETLSALSHNPAAAPLLHLLGDAGVTVFHVTHQEIGLSQDREEAGANSNGWLICVLDVCDVCTGDVSQLEGHSLRTALSASLPALYRPDVLLFSHRGVLCERVVSACESETLISDLQTTPQREKTASLKVDRVALRRRVVMWLRERYTDTNNTDTDTDGAREQKRRRVSLFCAALCDKKSVSEFVWSTFCAVLPHITHMELSHMAQESFFSLGGDSVSAVEVLYTLRQAFSLHTLTLAHLTLSVNELAHRIVSKDLDIRTNTHSDAHIDTHAHTSTEFTTRSHGNTPLSGSGNELSDVSWRSVVSRGCVVPSSPVRNESLTHTQQREMAMLWRHKLLRCVDATPTLVCGEKMRDHAPESVSALIVASHYGDIRCLDALRGEKVWWEQRVNAHIEASPVVSLSHSTVMVASYAATDIHFSHTDSHAESARHVVRHAETENHRFYDDVYDLSRTDSLGTVRGFSLSDGVCAWAVHTMGEVKCAPVLYTQTNNTTHSGEEERVLFGDYAGVVYDVSVACGTIRGRVCVEGSVYASPTLAHAPSQTLAYVATTRGFVYALRYGSEESGEGESLSVLWVFDSEGLSLFSSPLSLPDNSVVLAFTDGSMACVGHAESQSESETESAVVHTAQLKWQRAVSRGPFFSSPVALPHHSHTYTLVGCHDGKLRLMDLTQEGEALREIDLCGCVFSTPCVLLSENESVVYVAATTTSGKCCVVRVPLSESSEEEMNVVREFSVKGEVFSSVVARENALYFGSRDDHVYCVQI